MCLCIHVCVCVCVCVCVFVCLGFEALRDTERALLKCLWWGLGSGMKWGRGCVCVCGEEGGSALDVEEWVSLVQPPEPQAYEWTDSVLWELTVRPAETRAHCGALKDPSLFFWCPSTSQLRRGPQPAQLGPGPRLTAKRRCGFPNQNSSQQSCSLFQLAPSAMPARWAGLFSFTTFEKIKTNSINVFPLWP